MHMENFVDGNQKLETTQELLAKTELNQMKDLRRTMHV